MNDIGSHYYDQQGNPVYEVPNVTKGGMRPTRIDDARKLGLVPSVNGILKVLNKIPLNIYISQGLVRQALSNPLLEGETVEDGLSRIMRMDRDTAAADHGTEIHLLIEQYFSGLEPSVSTAEDAIAIESFKEWATLHQVFPVFIEKSFCHMDYGGRLDFCGYVDGELVVVDWKTQRTTDKYGKSRAITFYPEYAVQLAAYRQGLGLSDAYRMLSVVISNSDPGRVESKLWDSESWQLETFNACKVIYYSPLGPGWALRQPVEGVK